MFFSDNNNNNNNNNNGADEVKKEGCARGVCVWGGGGEGEGGCADEAPDSGETD